jgi:hypothetical protein
VKVGKRVAITVALCALQLAACTGFRTVHATGALVQNPRDATFLVDGKAVALRNGQAVQTMVPGAASVTRTRLLGAPVYGDVDGDGDTDVVFLLLQDHGGSGSFYHVVVAYQVEGGYRGGNAVLLGDRITPQRVDILHGLIVVDFLERGPGEPMSAPPGVRRTVYLAVDDAEGLVLGGKLAPGERIVEGWVRFAHEVRSFEPCAEPLAYWLRGDSPALADIRAQVDGARTAPGAHQLMILAGRHSDPPADGFGADYHAAWVATRVLRAVAGGACRSDQIILDEPARNAAIVSPLHVSGRARGSWFFEGDFPIVLQDRDGKTVASGFATAQGEWMPPGLVPFAALLRFESQKPGPARLLLKKDNPSDRRERDDMLVVPLFFR